MEPVSGMAAFLSTIGSVVIQPIAAVTTLPMVDRKAAIPDTGSIELFSFHRIFII